MSPQPAADGAPAPRLALIALLAVLGLLALKCAWVSDDAYITFRVLDNFVGGHGLRWNVAERVQAYTNPLWLFALAPFYAATREPYVTSIVLGIAVTLTAAAWLAFRGARGLGGVVALLVLAGSKAFVDYSTSGLENPLLHLALCGALLAFTRSHTLGLALACSAVALTRLDGLVLVAPLLAVHAWQQRHARAWARIALGFAPLVAWELFSLVYYGALVPNSAIAKLSTGLPASELTAQGLRYLVNSLAYDPLTLCAILSALVIAFAQRELQGKVIAVGIALHLVYVAQVGGDFMSGRFLTPALFAAAFVIGRASISALAASAGSLLALALALVPANGPLRAEVVYSAAPSPSEHIDDSGISDERAYWYAYAGLFSPARSSTPPPFKHVTQGHPLARKWRDEGPKVTLANGIGYIGYWAGPSVHLVDPLGLSDALIARLPIYVDGALVEPERNAFRERAWRVGHYYRHVPEGYLESLEDRSRTLADPGLAARSRRLDLLTRGPLWTRERWSAIASECAFR